MSARIVGVGSTLAITRYIDPDVMGEVGTASILVVTAHIASHLGLANYAIVKHDDGPDVTFSSTVSFFFAGVLALAIVLLFGDWFSAALKIPAMAQYIPGLVLATFIRRLGTMPNSVLAREMRFGPVALSVTLGELTYACSSVYFAWLGWGGQSVVWANVLQSSIMTLIVVTQVNWREYLAPCRITWARLKDQAKFGVPVGLVSLAHHASSSWDNLIYLRYFGAAKVGIYNLGYNLAAVPAVHIGEQVCSVLLASMSKTDGDGKRRALVRSLALMSLLVFPLGIGLFAVSDSLVATLLPPKWQDVAPIVAVLSLVTLVRPMGWIAGPYMVSKSNNWTLLMIELIKLGSLIGGIIVFSRFGAVVACAGVGLGFGVQSLIYLYLLSKDGISIMDLLHSMIRPVLPCIPMAGAVFAVRATLVGAGVESPLALLSVEIVTGIIVFIPMAFLLAGSISRDFVGLLKEARRGD